MQCVNCDPWLVTFDMNPNWPELDFEWLVVPCIAANDDLRHINSSSIVSSDSIRGAEHMGDVEQSVRSPSERQLAFLKLLAKGMTVAEISEEIGISARTAEQYRRDLFNLAGVNDRVTLVLWGVRNGLVKL